MISIVYYNDNMLIEILLLVPAKSLTRFKLVCIHWLSLISTDQFYHLYALCHTKLKPSHSLHTQTLCFLIPPDSQCS
ncbi:hypothetical protein ACS0TY_026942 [Phlomoides rotata]